MISATPGTECLKYQHVSTAQRGPTRVLAFDSDAQAAAWRLKTGADPEVRGGQMQVWRYDFDRWAGVWGLEHFGWVLKFQTAARDRINAGLAGRWPVTIEEMARLLGVSEPTVRRFIQALADPELCDLKWTSLRVYLRFEEDGRPRNGRGQRGNRPYTVCVLLEPFLHPADAADWNQLSEYFAGQRALYLPENGEKGSQNDSLKGSQSETYSGEPAPEWSAASVPECGEPSGKGSQFESQKGSQTASLSGTACMSHAMPCPKGGMALTPSVETESPDGPEALRARAAAALAAQRFPERDAARLLDHHPEAPLWAVRWCEWIRCKTDLQNPCGFLARMIRNACGGIESARVEPWAYTRLKETGERAAEKRRAGLRAYAPAPRPAEPRPAARPTPPAELAALDQTLRRSASGTVVGVLELASPWQREGGTLTLAVFTETGLGLLNTFRRQLLRVVQMADAAVTDLAFIQVPEGSP